MRQLSFALFLLACAATQKLSASICVADTLSNYEALSGGCQVGPFTVIGFTYTQLSGSVTIPDTGITVTPFSSASVWSLTFSSPDFNLSYPNSADYLLAYFWDPGDIRSFEDVMTANSPVFPGFATVTTNLCENANFAGSTCSGATASVTVTDNGISSTLTSATTFSPDLSTIGVRNNIDLDATAGGSSEIASFTNVLATPEPSTLALCMLAMGLVWRRRRLQRVKLGL